MVDGIPDLVLLAVVVLPGALYTWAFEREAAAWGARLTDRLFRFIGYSAIFAAVMAWPAFLVWKRIFHHAVRDAAGQVEVRNLFADGGPIPLWFWLVPLAYVVLPIVSGSIAGHSLTRWPRIARVLAGKNPAPRAWDHVFFDAPSAILRIRLKDGAWVGGLFGRNSYAAGYPEEPQDLYLERTYRVDGEGNFEVTGSQGESFVEVGSGLLVRWDEIKHVEFFESEEA